MIVIDKDNKNLVIPNGLGNINRDYQEGYEAGSQESFEEGKAEGKAEGLAEGKAIGIAEGKQIQKDLLETITITENGTYNKEDGYNQVVVDVPDTNGDYQTGYNEGYEAGEIEQKSKLTNITISENGTYTREDGYNTVVVNVPDLNGDYQTGYDEGYADGVENGVAEELEKLPILDITENGEYRTINKGVNVNVIAKVKLQNGIKLGDSTFDTLPDYLDFSEIIDWSYMFNDCTNLVTIPLLDISKATSLDYTFNGCKALITIPQLNTSNVVTFDHTFYHCDNLTTLPQLNTSKVNNFGYAFAYCKKLQSLPAFDASSFNQFTCSGIFRNGGGDSLTDFGGFQNLKISITDGYALAACPNLSYQSCINILNGLYDFTGNGETPTSIQGQLKVHQNFIDLVGDEISIGTNKGWSISA